MKTSKTVHDVLGHKIKCPSFDQCPLCFGCRAFDPKYEDCKACEKHNKKKNICVTQRHKPDLVARMIRKEVIRV